MRHRPILAFAAAALWLVGCGQDADPPTEPALPLAASFVGGQQCASCHLEESNAWQDSHHDLAIQLANPESVVGDFSDATFTYNGVTSEFFERDGGYGVRTDGLDGALEEYIVTHAFGVEPLQQYLVEVSTGRFQALSIAWDTRAAAAGGQRWFHLYEDEAVDHADPLHWTGIFQNWNGTCAECHSTDLRKNFDSASGQYDTAYTSLNVDCEACHGPGSLHVAAPTEVPLNLKRDATVTWRFVDDSGIAQRDPPLESRIELETCAQCHSRRSQFSDDFKPGDAFLDSYRPSFLEENLYHADGQIQDEVYVYGSFLQSRMHAAGVSCSDCHDPHSVELRVEGNALCGQCHVASRYDQTSHHGHARETAGSFCVDCHMPETTYMVVDPRRDHSFRVPRPDLTTRIGTPNACNGCHLDESSEWASATVDEWFPGGRQTTAHYGEALHAGRTWAANRGESLRELVSSLETPAIVRATAIALMAQQLDDAAIELIVSALQGSEPLVQLAALDALQSFPPEMRVQPGQQFLTHPLRSLRMTAARVLLPARPNLSERRSSDLDAALAEYREAQFFNADRPEGLLNWGTTLMQLGQTDAATELLDNAITLAPYFAPAYINLADALRLSGSESDAQTRLDEAIESNPDDAGAHFALGLSLVRSGDAEAAYEEFRTAAELEPGSPHYRYVIGIALNSSSDREGALMSLADTHERFPGHRDTLLALATIHRDGGEIAEALEYTNRLLELSASDSVAQSLLAELETLTP
ncbi:MAG: tetratricopeptide repeat protein [Gammaproteobacteria bacterium]